MPRIHVDLNGLELEQARRRAEMLGVTLPEYVADLVRRDTQTPPPSGT